VILADLSVNDEDVARQVLGAKRISQVANSAKRAAK
jgi:hypothetical protein